MTMFHGVDSFQVFKITIKEQNQELLTMLMKWSPGLQLFPLTQHELGQVDHTITVLGALPAGYSCGNYTGVSARPSPPQPSPAQEPTTP